MAQAPQLPDTPSLVADLVQQASQLVASRQIQDPLVIGIHTGGVWIAEALAQALSAPLGKLDISFYRDDFTQQGLNPKVNPSNLPFDVNNRDIILVDDVLMSGRTVRAALNEIFDYGRPASIKLATLCAINSRQLPIQTDICALHLDLTNNQYLQLDGPDPLQLTLIEQANDDSIS
ncbi:MAG: bifunctional pyr operon transcriptional regulator/uracil phosphoribosyltransferase PyrR [Gammaproteobacteria bacterium]|jgi:pyrimidine operon attenuation protein/uracil phosphoribosyltransferase|nr:bifunctional pyr operon transcriptional regulator/uracil phosphoribosyltransferase PyrR [Gammaproteobacteria bacterium]MCP4878941.1 bifunctional pyr operon transcriptional regulator/uracil phosphoribosyltransferase PyrR [Gammaproteobacteria bacterium]MDP6164748.1 bifunctional pyr operon transcriptional regulator/uracil phosphoribosyltransferase PyrR [Gammaproteobacteria bacterium]